MNNSKLFRCEKCGDGYTYSFTGDVKMIQCPNQWCKGKMTLQEKPSLFRVIIKLIKIRLKQSVCMRFKHLSAFLELEDEAQKLIKTLER